MFTETMLGVGQNVMCFKMRHNVAMDYMFQDLTGNGCE